MQRRVGAERSGAGGRGLWSLYPQSSGKRGDQPQEKGLCSPVVCGHPPGTFTRRPEAAGASKTPQLTLHSPEFPMFT